MPEFKGIELVSTEASMSHSRVLETDKNVVFMDILYEKFGEAKLLYEASALNTLANMNYQVCNGGFDQYIFNGYHTERDQYNEKDVSRIDIHEQYTYLRVVLIPFAKEVFGEESKQARALTNIYNILKEVEKDAKIGDSRCEECDGDGYTKDEHECYNCNGDGEVGYYNEDREPCDDCDGTGRVTDYPNCDYCNCGTVSMDYDQHDNGYTYGEIEQILEMYAEYICKSKKLVLKSLDI